MQETGNTDTRRSPHRKKSRCNYNPLLLHSPGATQARKSRNATFQRKHGSREASLLSVSAASRRHRHTHTEEEETLPDSSTFTRNETRRLTGFRVLFAGLSLPYGHRLTLRVLPSAADFPGFREVVHGSPDTEASSPQTCPAPDRFSVQ